MAAMLSLFGDIGDDGEIVVTEAIPTTNEFAPDDLARRTAHGFQTSSFTSILLQRSFASSSWLQVVRR
jgi:hypothetical protein